MPNSIRCHLSQGGRALLLALPAFLAMAVASDGAGIRLRPIGSFDAGGAEIAAYDSGTQRLYVIDAADSKVTVLDIGDPTAARRVATLDLSALGGGINSVAVHQGLVAVAVEAVDRQQPGQVAFFDAAGTLRATVQVGALPDMVTFTPDGSLLLVANEGEPKDYCQPGLASDPEGSVSIVDLAGGVGAITQAKVQTAGFAAWNLAPVPDGVRVFGPGATPAQDFEPETIAVDADSKTAWVALQENNAIAQLDLVTKTFTAIYPLGTKDHSRQINGFDASDRDGEIRIVTHAVEGMYLPDTIAAYRAGDATYLVTANEGDAREYECFDEQERVGGLDLDTAHFPDAAALQQAAELGRLRVTTVGADLDGDGDSDRLRSFGARSFSIWSAEGALVFDSGKDFETLLAARLPDHFGSNNDDNDSFDSRSDDKGPEPEGLAVGEFRGRTYAFIGLERIGGVMAYDITDPERAYFADYATARDFTGDPDDGGAGELGPEGVLFLPHGTSPNPGGLVITANEESGTVTFYSVRRRRP